MIIWIRASRRMPITRFIKSYIGLRFRRKTDTHLLYTIISIIISIKPEIFRSIVAYIACIPVPATRQCCKTDSIRQNSVPTHLGFQVFSGLISIQT